MWGAHRQLGGSVLAGCTSVTPGAIFEEAEIAAVGATAASFNFPASHQHSDRHHEDEQ